MGKGFLCPVCGSPHDKRRMDISLPYPAGSLEIYRCRCGLGYSNYAVDGVPADVYDYSYYDHIRYTDESSRRLYVSHLVPSLERAVKEAGLDSGRKRLLDIGCATGDFLEYASEAGWRAEGIDVSGFAVETARKRGLAARVCPIEDLDSLGSTYDVITMWDVIEHLPDMASALGYVARALSPGGVAVIKTVSRRSIVDFMARAVYTATLHRAAGPLKRMYVPGHLFYFTPATLERLISRFGEALFIEHTDTPPEALVPPGLMRAGFRYVFSAQKALGMTFELIAAWRPGK